MLLAERYAARRRAPVYMYSLDWQSPAHGGRVKAHHAMDLPFVFDNTDVADTTAGAPGARELAARISATWIAFARNGSPNNPAIPTWPRLHDGGPRDDDPRHRLPCRARSRPRGAAVVEPRRRVTTSDDNQNPRFAKKRFSGRGRPRFSRKVLPSYSRRNRPRRCSSGTTRSTKSSRPPGTHGNMMLKPSQASL